MVVDEWVLLAGLVFLAVLIAGGVYVGSVPPLPEGGARCLPDSGEDEGELPLCDCPRCEGRQA